MNEKGALIRFCAAGALMAVLAVIGVNCSGGDPGPGTAVATADPSLKLQWPEGFRHDPENARLYLPSSGDAGRSAPAYVTSVTLRVSGEGLETIIINVPLDTLSVPVTVTLGLRTFEVLAETNIGATFTGSATVFIGPGFSGPVVIAMQVNGPPVIHSVSFSTTDPLPGDTIYVDADVSDPDPDDILTFEWKMVGSFGVNVITTNGPSVSFAVVPATGTVFFELTVSDGNGGFDTRTDTMEASGFLDIDTIHLSDTAPAVGDIITATVVWITAPPATAVITYDWAIYSISAGWTYQTGTGLGTINIPIDYAETYFINLTVFDQYGATDTMQVNTGGTCPTLGSITGLTAVGHASINGGVTVSWAAAVPNADGYKVSRYNFSGTYQASQFEPTLAAVVVGGVNTVQYYGVAPYNNCGNMGPEVSLFPGTPTTVPGAEQVTGLVASTATVQQTQLDWAVTNSSPSGTATDYDVYFKQTATPGVVSTTVFDGTANAGTNTYTHNCPTASQQWYYIVVANDGAYAGTPSAEVTWLCPP